MTVSIETNELMKVSRFFERMEDLSDPGMFYFFFIEEVHSPPFRWGASVQKLCKSPLIWNGDLARPFDRGARVSISKFLVEKLHYFPSCLSHCDLLGLACEGGVPVGSSHNHSILNCGNGVEIEIELIHDREGDLSSRLSHNPTRFIVGI